MAQPLSFNMAISIINLLGIDLYRDSITVLGEAISNSWDAEAENVWIEIDENGKCFSIRDDGIGMSGDDFQNKFLKIGYSKRIGGKSVSPNKKRPYIGRKGVGKLALLSCAKKVHIASTKNAPDYIGGIVDNDILNEEIKKDSNVDEYKLTRLDESIFKDLKDDHDNGTILYFENINDGVNINPYNVQKLLALHFRFDLIIGQLKGDKFSIFVNNQKVKLEDLKELSKNTEFLWPIDEFDDSFFRTLNVEKQENLPVSNKNIKGFIASVKKPSNLVIFDNKEKTGVDIFVNGRLRETNILKHAPAFATRYIASYIYGQIHLDILDDANSENNQDIFQTTREGIKLTDATYKKLLDIISKEILAKVSSQWKGWRGKEKSTIPKYLRLASESNIARKKEFEKRINKFENMDSDTKAGLVRLLEKLSPDNTSIYQDLFILENLFRGFLEIRGISNESDLKAKFPGDTEIIKIIKNISDYKRGRIKSQNGHELTLHGKKITAREYDLNYLGLKDLSDLIDKVNKNNVLTIKSDTKKITPVRDVVMHTNQVSKDVAIWNDINELIERISKLDAAL